MARRTFVSNGITYSDCEPGWLKAHKDDWDIKLTPPGPPDALAEDQRVQVRGPMHAL